MKTILLLVLFSQTLWAKPVVLIGHFEPFGKSKINNSTTTAEALNLRLKNDPNIELKLCKLSTSFDKAFTELEACARELPVPPKLIIGLGESKCDLRLETMGRNLDHTFGPDNDGIERKNKPIVLNGPKAIGIHAPVAQMWCGLSLKDQKDVIISQNAGSFVCNNLIYQYLHAYPEDDFSFIHVPTSNCRNLERKNQEYLPKIESMIRTALISESPGPVPTTKKEITLLKNSLNNNCQKIFYDKIKGSDERGF